MVIMTITIQNLIYSVNNDYKGKKVKGKVVPVLN
jgi:hypothetical protein